MAAARDAWAITGRNLIVYRRVPTLLVFTLVQPIVFVLLFRYVFGGAIKVPGGIPYVDYLMPGIFVQTVAFGATNTAIGLATDVKSGLLERFHSLPMARSAVLTGRTFADLTRNVLVVALMAVVGVLVGFRVQTNALLFVAGILVVLMFAYAFSWIFATVGLCDRRPRKRPGRDLPGAGAARLCLVGVRAGEQHAELAAGLCHLPAGLGDRQRRARPHARRADPLVGAAVDRLVRRHRARLRAAGRVAVPARELSCRDEEGGALC